jgi:aryl-alcohol dehydrogenase-like predicted oxidoreductase
MKTAKIDSLEVSNLCLGGNVFGWTIDEATSFQILDAFVNGGGTFIDTADIYSRWAPGHQGGESEKIIGKWLSQRKNRSRLVIATKVGMDMGDNKKGLAAPYILSAVEDSLKRLQTDFIDLYISHRADESTPIESTLEAYERLQRQGKIRVIGASNYSGSRLQNALDVSSARSLPAYRSLQPHYNLYDRAEFEKDLLAVCQKNNLAVTPYFSLASGFLTGKYRNTADLKKSQRGGGMEKYLNERGTRILAALDLVAKEHQSSPATVAIAWLMSRPFITAPIASATSLAQMESLLAASRLHLSPASIDILNRASEVVENSTSPGSAFI